MKYIITDLGEVNIGPFPGPLHAELAQECKGKVIAAGHCEKKEDGTYEVWGESIGFNIKAKNEDRIILMTHDMKKLAEDTIAKLEGNTPWS